MKTCISKLIYIVLSVIFIYGCHPDIDVPTPSSGSVDFTKYIAIGNSFTAGYADGGLYEEGQLQSYPKLIAQQMNEITRIDFVQPDISGNGSGYLYITSLDLSTDPPDVGIGSYDPDQNWLNQLEGSFNNLGVPGIRVKDINFSGYGSSPQVNPYFYRMLGGKSSTTTYLELVQESNPTFFTSWIGINDVLGYATTGGEAGIEGAPGTGLGGLTDPGTEFKPLYDALIAALTSNGAKGILLTIPDVTQIPYFTTVPWNGAILDEGTAAQANQFYAAGIDTAVEAGVQEAVIALTVTEQAVSTNVVPSVAQGAVYQQAYEQAYQQAIDAGEPPENAAIIAENAANDYVGSNEGQTAITQLEAGLNAELQNHLLGTHSNHQDIEVLYALIDNELATNTALQQGIAQGIQNLTLAYENEQLPPDQQTALETAISQGTQEQIALLKAAGIYPVFQAGPNGFVIYVPQNESNPLGLRQLKEGEFILLTALLEGQLDGLTALEPKEDKYILTVDEVENIRDYTDSYNQIINEYTSSANIGLVDTDNILEDVNNGIYIDGVSITGEFLTGGAFSMDGIHFTPRGYAIIANKIIERINSEFNARISPVNLNNHRAVILP